MSTITSLGFSIFSTYDGSGVNSANKSLDSLNKNLAETNTKTMAAASSMFSVVGTLAAIGPAVMPIGAAALGASAGLATMAAVGAGAAGIFGAAIMAASQSATRAGHSILQNVNGVKVAFAQWGATIAPAVAKPVDSAMQAVVHSFSKLTPVVTALVPEANNVANAFYKWTSDGSLQTWVNWLASNGVIVIDNFVNAGKSLGTMFGAVLTAFAPMGDDISSFIANLAAKGSTWATGGGFDRFALLVQENAPPIELFFKTLFEVLANAASAMTSMGGPALSLATGLLAILAACPPATIIALVQAFIAFKSPITWLAENFPGLITGAAGFVKSLPPDVINAIAAAFVALKLAMLAASIAQELMAAGAIIAAVQLRAMSVAQTLALKSMYLWDGACAIAAAATTGLDIAMMALEVPMWVVIGIMGLIVIAVAALAFGIYELVTHWTTVWNAVKSVASTVWTWIEANWVLLLSILVGGVVGWVIYKYWNTIWSTVQGAASAVWTWIENNWKLLLAILVAGVVGWLLFKYWSDIWSAAKQYASTTWQWIQSTWQTTINSLKSAWDTVSSTLTNAWSTFWNGLKSTASTIWTDITTAVGKAWKDIANAFVDPVNFVINTVWDGGIARIWNDTAGAIGLSKLPTEKPIAKMATGGPVPLMPGATVGRDSVHALLMPDEHVLSVPQVRQLGGHQGIAKLLDSPMHFAGGGSPSYSTGRAGGLGAGANAGNAPTGTTYQATNSISISELAGIAQKILSGAASTAMHGIVDPLISAIPGDSGIKNLLQHGANAMLNDAINAIGGHAQAANVGGALPVGSHKSLIDSALAKAGIAQSQWPGWESGLNTLITRESSWNPNAINLTDSNAQAGHPSQGLMQEIPSTFAAYSLGGSITDPLSNIVAGIRYIVATYGGIGNVQQANALLPSKGYASGTNSAQAGWHMIDENGAEWINFKGGEQVLPNGTNPTASGTDSDGDQFVINMTNNWNGNPTQEAVEYATSNQMVDDLRKALKAGKGMRPY